MLYNTPNNFLVKVIFSVVKVLFNIVTTLPVSVYYIIALVLICWVITNIVSPIICNRWTLRQRNRIRQNMELHIPRQRRRDHLYVKLSYQYASNEITGHSTSYNSMTWSRDGGYPILSANEISRVQYAVETAIRNNDVQAEYLDIDNGRVYYRYDRRRRSVKSSPQFMSLIHRYDRGG